MRSRMGAECSPIPAVKILRHRVTVGTDLQRIGRMAPIAPKLLKRARDHRAFLGMQIETVLSLTVISRLEDLRRQLSGLNAGPASHDCLARHR